MKVFGFIPHLLLIFCGYDAKTAKAQVDHSFWGNETEYVDHAFGGKDTKITEFVWFTAVRTVGKANFKCSGSLIGVRYVVTASHCVDSPISNFVEVSYYCKDRGNCGRKHDTVGVRSLYRHKQTGSETGGDLVLLELNREIEFPAGFHIRPAVPYLGKSIHRKQRFLKKGRKMTIVGAGQEAQVGEVSLYVKKLVVAYVPPKTCRTMISNPSLVDEHSVCSVAKNHTGSPCYGDSGAAIVVPGKRKLKGRDVIMAIHTGGPRRCEQTRADHAFIHFRMEDAAPLLQERVCGGAYPEDWCGAPPTVPRVTDQPSQSPTAAPASAPAPTTSTLQASLLHTLRGHRDTVWSVSFNSDGSLLLSGSADRLILLWDPLNPDAAIGVFRGHSDWIRSVQWSPSENLIASGSRDQCVKLWDVNKPKEPPVDHCGEDGDFIVSVAWHPDGKLLASGSFHHSRVQIWNVESGEVQTKSTLPDPVYSVAFHPDGTQLAAATRRTIRLWDATNSYTLLRTLVGHTNIVWAISYSPDGRHLASAAIDGSVRVWDVESGATVQHFVGHEGGVRAVAWSPNGKYVVSGSDKGDLKVWDAQNGGNALLALKGNHGFVGSVDWSPDGMLISSAATTTIEIWKIEGA